MDSHDYYLRRVRASVSAIRQLVESMPAVALKPPMPARANYIGANEMRQLGELLTTLDSDLNALESEIDDLTDEES